MAEPSSTSRSPRPSPPEARRRFAHPRATEPDRILDVPNLLSFLRLLGVPLFL